MRRVATISIAAVLGLSFIFLLAGRRLGELGGYVRATAATGVEELEDNLPQEIHDRKLANDLDAARQDLIDRQVQLNLSRRQLTDLQSDVERLAASVARRKRLLAEAYPVLRQATDENLPTVIFASHEQPLAAFQADVDELMAQQERESRQLEIKRDGLTRLETSVREGETALAEMRRALESTEQEVAVLKSRRGQAEIEANTLDMIASVTEGADAKASSINQSLTRLRTDVDELEAQNEARRDLAPVGDRPMDNQVARNWSRLETLKAIADEQHAEEQPAVARKPVANVAPKSEKRTAEKVVIEIQSRDADVQVDRPAEAEATTED